jgi:hypothetical protein
MSSSASRSTMTFFVTRKSPDGQSETSSHSRNFNKLADLDGVVYHQSIYGRYADGLPAGLCSLHGGEGRTRRRSRGDQTIRG